MSDDPGNNSFGSDSFTETTHRSWFQRIGGALTGVLIGLVMIPGAIWLLAWNEGRAAATARSLAEGARLVLSVTADRVDPANDGKLVHVAGPVRVPGALADPEFGLRIQGAAQLRRKVEMYQWREESRSETRSRLGGGQETVTTYSYTRGWSDQAIDSSRFRQPDGHANPPMRVQARNEAAREGQLGAFRLGNAELGQLGNFQTVAPDAVPPRFGATPIEGGLYLGADPAAPRIGDIRVTWSYAPAEQASVIGQQASGGFTPYQTRAGDRLLLVSDGIVPASAMIRQAEQANAILTWILRAVGTLLVFVGAYLLMNPIVVLADVMPLFGSIAGFGAGLVALLVTVLVAPLTIALAWLWVRPLVGGAVLAVGALLAFGVTRLMKARRAARPAPLAARPAAAGPGGPWRSG
jgi:hypothetical protein